MPSDWVGVQRDGAARRDWTALHMGEGLNRRSPAEVRREIELLAPHPEPEVRAREATELETPAPCRSLRRLAVAHGWDVLVTYARGSLTPATHGVRAERVVCSVAFRGRHPDGRRAAAVWFRDADRWSADVAWCWREDPPTHPVRRSFAASKARTLTIKEWITGDEGQSAA